MGKRHRGGVWTVYKWEVCAGEGEECGGSNSGHYVQEMSTKGYGKKHYVQERSVKGMTMGSMYRKSEGV